MSGYHAFFRDCTGYTPYPWQVALATASEWPELVDVPTGLGKTQAVLVAWLWRLEQAPETTPRRLVYCLPMRTLVTQTSEAAQRCVERAAAQLGGAVPTVHVMMGGEADEVWAEHPERPAIVVGTQDLLVSRALNRGYAMSRYAWPMHFGLLNNDALWVFDETQLMGVSVETSAQLQGLRRALGTARPTASLWMSATLDRARLETFDHRSGERGRRVLELSAADRDHGEVLKRISARKRVEPLGLTVSKETDLGSARELARAVVERHRPGSLTLVVLNRVDRARMLHEALIAQGCDATSTVLVHSRFRPGDRRAAEAVLLGGGDRIVVATQAVEAGVDVSAHTLITELAPWSSLVQRFGRCNRYGELAEGRVYWIDLDLAASRGAPTLPYTAGALAAARQVLATLEDCGPRALAAVEPPADDAPLRPVLRRRDLLELFDTSAELSGDDLDVSRYVRDEDDSDVQCFWRTIDEAHPLAEQPAPARDELCRVSIGAARDFFGRSEHPVWVWDGLERSWTRLERSQLRPGLVVMLKAEAGGYTPQSGWTGNVKGPPVPPPSADEELDERAPAEVLPEGLDDEPGTQAPQRWLGLTEHLRDVVEATRELADALVPDDAWREALLTAAAWHDVGKAHAAFQAMLVDPVRNDPEHAVALSGGPWAKSGHSRRLRSARRPHFRHELASALAWLQAGGAGVLEDLIAFLIAGHHGKVRMVIRALPGEAEPEGERPFARGVHHGDVLAAVTLPDGREVPELALDLSVMGLGEGCWLERMLALRDAADLGPFRLAWLETLLRTADHRASARERGGDR